MITTLNNGGIAPRIAARDDFSQWIQFGVSLA
jgi:hypothetical protein